MLGIKILLYKRFKIHFAIIIFILSYQYSIAQCNIDYRESGQEFAFDTARETIFKNEDLENGLFNVYSSSTLFFDKNNRRLHKKYVISFYVGSSGSKTLLIPSKVKIVFKNGEVLTSNAETTSEPKTIRNAKIVGSGFPINDKQTLMVLDNEINYIILTDSRNNNTFKFYPNKKYLKDQLDCLILKASSN